MKREEARRVCFIEINNWIYCTRKGLNPNFNAQARASAHAIKWTMEALGLINKNELLAITDLINQDTEIPLD